MRTRFAEYRSYARGWLGYFGLAQVKVSVYEDWTSGFGDEFELVI